MSIWTEAIAKIAFTLFCVGTLYWWLDASNEPVQIGAVLMIVCLIIGWILYPVLFSKGETE